jgi:hypothetical protein
MILLLSCFFATQQQPCAEDADCGLGFVCDAKACAPVVCSSSAQCPMLQHCSDDGSCTAGCAEDGDCYPGQRCSNSGSCLDKACEDTRTDCGLGERCDGGTGECESDLEGLCGECNSDLECDGGYCWEGRWCARSCSTTEDCPAGFDCLGIAVGDGQEALACVGSCWSL